MSPTRIGFLLGRDPGPYSVLPRILDRIRAAGVQASVQVLQTGAGLEPWLFDADLVVLRSLDLHGLALARGIEEAGVPCCNAVDATRLARDKAACLAALERAGVPVPISVGAESWRQVRASAAGRAVVIKSVHGSRGSGVLMAEAGALPRDPSFAGPYLVQDRIDHRGPDRKVYVVGDRMAGVLRRWPPAGLRDKQGAAFTPSDRERRIVAACGHTVGLELFGVDIVGSSSGPVVVDVNAFPGYKGVAGADAWLADHLLGKNRRPQAGQGRRSEMG
ncbi:MAG: hypothetical protein ABI595_11425 [Actinomycetota bacterium]